MKKTIIIFFLFFCIKSQCQDISGEWTWNYQNKHKTDIKLERISEGRYKGIYCSVFYEGNKIDCVENDKFFCLSLTRTSLNLFEGEFKSSYSKSKGVIEIEYIPKSGKIRVFVKEKPKKEFYLPTNVIFSKI